MEGIVLNVSLSLYLCVKSKKDVTLAAAVPPRKQAKPARERYTYQQP